MGLGSTAKTLQRVADMAENVYSRLNDVRDQLDQLRSTVNETDERVARLESEMAEQRALFDALAERQGIDVEGVTAELHIDEAESGPDGTVADEATTADGAADESTAAESTTGPTTDADGPTDD